MSRLIVSEFMSLDGVMEAPGGEPTHLHSGWTMTYAGPENMEYKLDEVREADSLLIGRSTYETFAGAWPQRDGEFADKMNAMAKYVVSSTLVKPEWNNTTVLTSDWAADVVALKERDDGPILVAGSATLVRALFEQELVDELRLMIFPVMIGGGLRCFPDSRQKLSFALADTKTFGSGVVVNTYTHART